jgi:hypothetical protein
MAKRIGLLFFLFFVTTTKNCSHMKDDARTELAQRTWVANKGRSFGQKREEKNDYVWLCTLLPGGFARQQN